MSGRYFGPNVSSKKMDDLLTRHPHGQFGFACGLMSFHVDVSRAEFAELLHETWAERKPEGYFEVADIGYPVLSVGERKNDPGETKYWYLFRGDRVVHFHQRGDK